MMFGQRKFGNPLAMTPENSMANIPVMGQQTGPMIDPRMTEQPKRGGGIFGRQSALWKVLGTIGDGLTGNPAYGQMQMQERQSLMQQEQERQKMQMQQQQRMDDRNYQRDDYLFKQDYERNNPKPINNDTVNDLNWYKGLTDADRKLYHQMKPTITYRADGTPMAVNPYDLQPQSGPQVGMIEDGHRFKGGNPADPASWEKVGGGVSNDTNGFPVSYEQFKRAIIQQESGGRYGIANAEGSGAMGIGQIMPDTAKALSRRLGLPFRPDLLSGNSQAARQYQDALTDAAVQEAWKYGGAGKDPRTSAQYYFAGPDKKGWGPKTRRYGQQVLGRIK